MFRMLDIDRDARLGEQDLALMVGKTRKEVAAMSAALPQVELGVGDRMGLSIKDPTRLPPGGDSAPPNWPKPNGPSPDMESREDSPPNDSVFWV